MSKNNSSHELALLTDNDSNKIVIRVLRHDHKKKENLTLLNFKGKSKIISIYFDSSYSNTGNSLHFQIYFVEQDKHLYPASES